MGQMFLAHKVPHVRTHQRSAFFVFMTFRLGRVFFTLPDALPDVLPAAVLAVTEAILLERALNFRQSMSRGVKTSVQYVLHIPLARSQSLVGLTVRQRSARYRRAVLMVLVPFIEPPKQKRQIRVHLVPGQVVQIRS